MQSLSGHYLMRQKVPMVFLLLLFYLGTVVYISVEISLGSFWRRGMLRVKGQALFTNCNFLWLFVICNHWVATIWCAIKYPRYLYFFGLCKCCCLHFCRNKFGLLLVQGYFKGPKECMLWQIFLSLHVWHFFQWADKFTKSFVIFTPGIFLCSPNFYLF